MSRAKSYTLGAWIKLWYEVYAEPRLREKTKDYYLNYIDNHIIPELGNTPLEKLATIQIQKFYNDLQKSGRIQRYTHIKLKDKVAVEQQTAYQCGFSVIHRTGSQ